MQHELERIGQLADE